MNESEKQFSFTRAAYSTVRWSVSAITRRRAIVLAASVGLGALMGFVQHAKAQDKRHALYGKWHVQCPAGHVDVVTRGTKQHKCEKDGCNKQCFVDGKVTVVCPKGHANKVTLDDVDVLQSYKCRTKDCGADCQGW